MSVRFLPVAMKKEFRALAPGWLACLALFAFAAVLASGQAQMLRIVVYFLGATALGALSMGHEYSYHTLSLLLSQPRRREHVLLLKLGVLASLLVVLLAVEFGLGVGEAYEQELVLAVPLLCGLFIAPWLTMLCRNPLAGMVFTVTIPGLVMLAGEIAAVVKFGILGPTMAVDANALKTAVLWWGMLGISAVTAASGWRMFMRLEAIDGRGQALRLPWLRAGAPLTKTAPLFAKRHPLWLLMKKELRLQQLSFVVGGLYVLGWLAVLSIRAAVPETQVVFLSALTALNLFAAPLLAGSLASAEERQLGVLEWHALLPMPARTQWTIKVLVVAGVASVLGLGVPMLLGRLTRGPEMSTGLSPLLSTGTLFAVMFLSALSLYISSLCANSLQALLWSVAAGFGLMTFASSWIGFFRLGFDPIDLFFPLRGWLFRSWVMDTNGRLFIWLALLSALAVAMYVGVFFLLLRFGRANHRSAERGSWRVSRQLIALGAFLTLVVSLWLAVDRRLEAESGNNNDWMRSLGTVTGSAVDSDEKPVTNYVVVVFVVSRDVGSPPLTQTGPFFHPVSEARTGPAGPGRFEMRLLPGRYLVNVIESMGSLRGDPKVFVRLKANAIPLTIAKGDSKTLDLTIDVK